MTDSNRIKELMDSFRRIVHLLRSSHKAAGDVSLTGAQLFVLASLGASSGPLGVKELAEATGTDQSTVSVVVGRLVGRGLVKRIRSKVDTRRVELSLTIRGRNLQRKAPATTAQTKLAESLGMLSTADSDALARILEEIVDRMGASDASAPMLFDENSPDDADGVLQRGGDSPRQWLRTVKKARPRSERKW